MDCVKGIKLSKNIKQKYFLRGTEMRKGNVKHVNGDIVVIGFLFSFSHSWFGSVI